MKNSLLLLLFASLLLSSIPLVRGQQVSKKVLLGQVQYASQDEFIAVDKPYASRRMFLQKETFKAFLKMYRAACEDGIELRIISGARNFEHQKAIWEKKWSNLEGLDPVSRAEKILEFSSMPATSRHHWGTDIDLNSLENRYFEEGNGKEQYHWLVKHANKYGFYQVYTSKQSGRTGYAEEKWHWSYLPIAGVYLDQYNKLITYGDIKNFKGAEWAKEKKMIADYVNGVSPKLHHQIEPIAAVSQIPVRKE